MKLTCPIRGIINVNKKAKDNITDTEEARRIECIKFLLDKNYPEDLIDFEVNVWDIGNAGRNHLRADIVVYKDKSQKDIDIIVEVKRDSKNRLSAINNQLLPACIHTNCNYGIYYDGVNNGLFIKEDGYSKEISLLKLPIYNHTYNKVPLIFSELKNIENIMEIIDLVEQLLHNIGKTKEEKYKEFFKIILSKYYDEKDKCDNNKPLEFQETIDIEKNIHSLYSKAKKYYSSSVDLTESINVDKNILIEIVKLLQNYSLLKSRQDILQSLFMKFAASTLKTELDQFYTPIDVVEFIAGLLEISNVTKIIDPAGGSGDFLVGCIKINNESSKNIYYWDYSKQAFEVAKLNMIISGDGRANMQCCDSIRNHDVDNNSFNIVITNPPFGTKTRFNNSDNVLDNYELYSKYGYDMLGALFIERGIKLLDDGGILCIILPHGYLTNPTDEKLRKYIVDNARIVAYISLPAGAFKGAETGVKAGILILKKEKLNNNYNIFTAVAENIGFNYKAKKLEKLYKKDSFGEYLLDNDNKKIPLSDFDDISKQFKQFIYDNNIAGFNRKNNNIKYDYICLNDIKENNLIINPETNTDKYKNIVNSIKSQKYTTLSNCDITNKKDFINIIRDQVYNYIDISNLETGGYALNNKLYGWNLPDRAKLKAEKHDIFISKLKGSSDKFCMILHDDVNKTIVTNGTYRIRIDDEIKRLSFYKFLFSNAYKIQMESLAIGSIMADIKEKDLRDNLYFPILSDEELEEMKSFVKHQEVFVKLKNSFLLG